MLLALLDAGHPVDERDKFGLTPLMYAAGLGHLDSAKTLLSAGADPSSLEVKGVERKTSRFSVAPVEVDFMFHALRHKKEEFIAGIIQYLKMTHQYRKLAQAYSMKILLGLVFHIGDVSEACLEVLVGAVEDINFKFDDHRLGHHTTGNHLLHYSWPMAAIKIIMKHGFNAINHKNSSGDTAVMNAAWKCHPETLQYYISMGANVQGRDVRGSCALTRVLSEWCLWNDIFWSDSVMRLQETARVLLHAGADTEATDDCDCHCSTAGCTFTHILQATFDNVPEGWVISAFFGTVEWLFLLEDCGKEDAMRSALTILIRRALFDAMGMTHTCGDSWRCKVYDGRYENGMSIPSAMHTRSRAATVVIQAQERDKRTQLEIEMKGINEQLSLAELVNRWRSMILRNHMSHRDQVGLPSWKEGLETWYTSMNDELPPKGLVQPFMESLNQLADLETGY